MGYGRYVATIMIVFVGVVVIDGEKIVYLSTNKTNISRFCIVCSHVAFHLMTIIINRSREIS